MNSILLRLSRLFSLALIAVFSAFAEATPVYTITDLGTLGGTATTPYAINIYGQITGQSTMAGNTTYHAFLYSEGIMIDIGTMDGSFSEGRAINASGQITGSAGTLIHAFSYSDGVMKDLGTLGGRSSWGEGINASGQITGTSVNVDNRLRAFLYNGGKMIDLGTLGGPSSQGLAINDNGQITGTASIASGFTHAFLYSGGRMIDIGTLGGSASVGTSINASGQIVGQSHTGSPFKDIATHAFLYRNGGMIDLGTLGGSFSTAYSINGNGDVVGSATDASGNHKAFLYSDGTMVDLNQLVPAGSGWILQLATSINDAGQIVGYGIHNGRSGAFLLTPQKAGVSLSSTSLSLIEGSASSAYTVVLTGAPSADIVLTISSGNQLSVSPTQLIFTPANWNIPQSVTVTAIHDGLAEGNHAGSVSHSISSFDARYNGIAVSNVTVAITDAVIPIINLSILGGSYWTQPNLPVSGTAGAGATVTTTAANLSTGEVQAVSAVAGANGAWNLTLTGLSDGNYELRPEAGDIHGSKVSIAIDSHAPISTLSITSTSPLTASGWHNASVNLAASAVDGTGGSGVVRSEYTLNGGAWTSFPNGGLNLNQDGNHTVCYRSADRAGNVEAARCVPLAIDTGAPSVNPVFDAVSNTLSLNAQDAVSGFAGIEISRDGGQNWVVHSGPVGFSRDGVHTVHYRVRDNAGNLANGQTSVAVVTVPAITALVSQTAFEAASQGFNLGAFTDQTADGPWSIDVDWGDGTSHSVFTLSAPGALGSLPHTYADNGSHSVTIKVTDQAGNSGSRSFPVTVANVVPTATLIATSGTLNEGDVATLTLTNPNDVSTVDVQAGFRYAFDCGDGAGYRAAGAASSITCTALDNPNQTVRGKVIDKDGGMTDYSAVLTIANVSPVLGAITGPTAPVVRETPATITAGFTDAGVRDTHVVVFDWDDGTASSGTVTEANGSGTVSASHSYAKPGRYIVTMTVTDKDSASAMNIYTIQVRGGPPAR